MKSLFYTAALLPFGALAWEGKAFESDEVVIVTSTRTVTVCPITEWFTCPTEGPTTSTSPTSVVVSTTSRSGSAATTSTWSQGGYSPSSSGAGPATSSSWTSLSQGDHGSWTSSSSSTSSSGTSSSPVGGSSTSSSWSTGSWTTSSPVGGSSTTSTSGTDTTTSSYSYSQPSSWSSSSSASTTSASGSTSTSTSSSPYGSTTTSGSVSTSTTSGSTSSGSSSTTSGSASTSSSTTSGSVSTSSSSTTSGSITTSGTVTTSGTTTTSGQSSTSASTSCSASATVSCLPESTCSDNTADDRSKWCGKSVTDDTHDNYETGQTKTYHLTITSAQSNFDGTLRPAFLINGGTPGPVIEANWGDWVEVTVTNLLQDNATTIHWHGIRQLGTNDQDGVPGVTECAIPPNGQRTYRWLASTFGTGWYHSHALSQYGGGIRGAVIIHGPATANYDYDMGSVMVDEIFSQSIFQMAYNIARLRGPLPAAVNYMLNGKNKAVDGSAGESAQWTVYPGKKHLFRIINSSAQASYVMHFDNHVMTVISADYTPIVPYTTNTLFINPGQRYNVIVEMNQTPGAYFFRAITQTGCGVTNLNTGLGNVANGVFTYQGSCGTPTTDNATAAIGAPLQGDCKDEPLASLVPIVPKDGGSTAEFSSNAELLPAGNANQVVYAGYGPISRWMFGPTADVSSNSGSILGTNSIELDYDNPTLKSMALLPSVSYNSSIYSNAVVLDGPANDWVYFVIQNNFQTSHPIHLHGHDFSVLGQGKGVFTSSMVGSLNFANPIRRDTALLVGLAGPGGVLASSGWTVIGFQTDNPGAWVMHCHIIWHADGGMALQYIEQPAQIDAASYYASASFQSECAAYDAYNATGGTGHEVYESGLKRDLQRHAYRESRFGRHGSH